MALAAMVVGMLCPVLVTEVTAGGGISGRVTGPEGEPLAGVEVHAHVVRLEPLPQSIFNTFPYKTGFAAWTVTGPDGSYELDLEPTPQPPCESFRHYLLVFSPPKQSGFTPKFYRGSGIWWNSGYLDVREGKTLSGIDVRLGPPASIAGTVTTPDAAPLAGASVVARYWMGYSYGEREWRTTTDDRGRYVITGLQDDEYYVQVTPADGSASLVFYPGTADPVRVRPIPGQRTEGYDIVVPTRGSIHVSHPDGVLGLWGFLSPLVPYSGYTQSNTFQIDGLPPGDYRIGLFPDWRAVGATFYPATFQPEEASPVAVRSGETASVTLVPAAHGVVNGRVVDGNGMPLDNVEVACVDAGLCYFPEVTLSNAAGDFTISSSGERKISFSKKGFLTTWFDGKADGASADAVQFRSGETITLPNIVLESRGAPGGITGLVTAAGAPLVGARIEIWASPAGSSALRTITPVADGTFEATELAPGSYLLRFFDATPGSTFGEKWYPEAVSAATATAVTVEPGLLTTGIVADLGATGSILGTMRLSSGPFTWGGPGACLADLKGNPLRCLSSTAGDGTYRFDGVAPGPYLLVFDWRQAYSAGLWYPDRDSAATAVPVVVAAGETIANVDGDLIPKGILQGQIDSSTGSAYSRLYAVDADTGIVRWDGMIPNGSPFFSWQVFPGRYRFLFTALDSDFYPQWYPGKSSASEAEIVEILPGQTVSGIDAVLEFWRYNRAPVLTNPGSLSATEGVESSFTLTADNPDGDLLTFSATNLPQGATLDPSTGSFSWTPTCTQAGAYPDVTFTVTDHGNPPLSASATTAVNVAGRDCAPVLDPIGARSVIAGEPLTFPITASDPEGDPVVLEAAGLPPGASFNAADGTFAWTPGTAQVGLHNVTFAVAYAADTSVRDEEVVAITVLERAPPVLDPIGARSVIAGESLTFQISGSDPLGDPVVLEASGLPAGASFNAADGTFAWTPGGAQAGVHLVTFAAAYAGDTSLRDEEVVAITVLGPLLFRDDFAHGDLPVDPDWVTVAGAWAVREGAFRSKLEGDAIALTGPGNLAGTGFAAGQIRSRVKLGPRALRTPDLAFVFGYRDRQHYRYVRFLPGATEIGQVGEIDGQPALRLRKARGAVAGRWWRARVDIHPGGLVRAFMGELPLAGLKFPTAVPGGVGVMTRNSRSFVDDFTLWARTVLD